MRRSLLGCTRLSGFLFPTLCCVLVLTPLDSGVAGQKINYAGSLQFATGDYLFLDRTNSIYLFNGISLSGGRFRASAGIPLIYQNSPWVSHGGTGMIPTGGPEHKEVGRGGRGGGISLPDTTTWSTVGIGDPLLRADVELFEEKSMMPSLRFGVSVKAPVADVDLGFGTGEWDYGGGVSIAKRIRGSTLLVDMTYWVLGDLEELELENPVVYGVSLGRTLYGGKTSVLLSFSGSSRIMEGLDPPVQLGLGVGYSLKSGSSILGSVGFGITETTPDFSISLGWQIGLTRSYPYP